MKIPKVDWLHKELKFLPKMIKSLLEVKVLMLWWFPRKRLMGIREALLTLARALTTHLTRDIGPIMIDLESTMTSTLREFVRINPPIFLDSKVGEDPQMFLDDVYMFFCVIGVTSNEK